MKPDVVISPEKPGHTVVETLYITLSQREEIISLASE
jgi:hypothetical protein